MRKKKKVLRESDRAFFLYFFRFLLYFSILSGRTWHFPFQTAFTLFFFYFSLFLFFMNQSFDFPFFLSFWTFAILRLYRFFSLNVLALSSFVRVFSFYFCREGCNGICLNTCNSYPKNYERYSFLWDYLFWSKYLLKSQFGTLSSLYYRFWKTLTKTVSENCTFDKWAGLNPLQKRNRSKRPNEPKTADVLNHPIKLCPFFLQLHVVSRPEILLNGTRVRTSPRWRGVDEFLCETWGRSWFLIIL